MPHKLINLKSSEYEHPFDKAALARVNNIPGLPSATNFILNWTVIKWKVVGMCGSNFHVTKEACPDLFNLAQQVIETIDLDKLPNLYMEQDYYVNAYTTGYKKDAFIVLSTGAVDKLSDDELRFVIGHEAGHVKSGHVLYHLMATFLAQFLSSVPGGVTFGTFGIGPALSYWNRMSEFTADRAGLLACQNLNSALSSIMKMSGLPERYYEKASIEGFMKQAHEFDQDYGGTTDRIIRTISIIDEDHPWTIVRAAELIRWVESGEYERILNETKGKKCTICGHLVSKDTIICPFCGNDEFEE